MKILFFSSMRNSMLMICISVFVISSCKKDLRQGDQQQINANAINQTNFIKGHLKQTNTFSSEVARKWQDMQLRILKLPAGPNTYGLNGVRYFAYTGIALYEAVVNGMPAYQSLYGQLTNMPAMPSIEPGKAYHWPSAANAALSFMNKHFYTLASTANKESMDSLENALNATYQSEINNDEEFNRSVAFGTEVAQRIFNWSTTDGSLASYPSYVISTDVTLWRPLAPNPTAVFAPYWGENRLFVQGSLTGTSSPLPPSYSEVPNSPYYEMVKEVYDISVALTTPQRETALYFRDNPGFQAGTHYISIFNQVMQQENLFLDQYAVAHVKTGVSIAEAQIGCWKMKYEQLVDRPIKYIRNVLGHTTWNPVLATPPHPDFPSGHSQTGGAFAAAMTNLFGPSYQITLHTYDNLGMAPRSYNSFNDMVDDIGRSRVYAGIHYTYSCEQGRIQGEKIAGNILSSLHFLK